MGIFDRLRRTRGTMGAGSLNNSGPVQLMDVDLAVAAPTINQRVVVETPGRAPVPTRIDDEIADGLVLADPGYPLEIGETLRLTWEVDGLWYGMDTRVSQVHLAGVPSITVDNDRPIERVAGRRMSVNREVSLPMELRVAVARGVKTGQLLSTTSVELSDELVRFYTTAPFAPGDTIEARIQLEGEPALHVRLRVIRMDTIAGAWRQICTADFHEILRSDVTRLRAYLEHVPQHTEPIEFARLEPPHPRNQG